MDGDQAEAVLLYLAEIRLHAGLARFYIEVCAAGISLLAGLSVVRFIFSFFKHGAIG